MNNSCESHILLMWRNITWVSSVLLHVHLKRIIFLNVYLTFKLKKILITKWFRTHHADVRKMNFHIKIFKLINNRAKTIKGTTKTIYNNIIFMELWKHLFAVLMLMVLFTCNAIAGYRITILHIIRVGEGSVRIK